MAVDRATQCKLVDSLLDTAWSLQTLESELDRVTSPGKDVKQAKKSKRRRKDPRERKRKTQRLKQEEKEVSKSHEAVGTSWLPEAPRVTVSYVPPSSRGELLTVEDAASCESLSRPSSQASANSNYDSAIGSLHSQLDDSFSSQPLYPPNSLTFGSATEGFSQAHDLTSHATVDVWSGNPDIDGEHLKASLTGHNRSIQGQQAPSRPSIMNVSLNTGKLCEETKESRLSASLFQREGIETFPEHSDSMAVCMVSSPGGEDRDFHSTSATSTITETEQEPVAARGLDEKEDDLKILRGQLDLATTENKPTQPKVEQGRLTVPLGSDQLSSQGKYGTAWRKVSEVRDRTDPEPERKSPTVIRRIMERRKSPAGKEKGSNTECSLSVKHAGNSPIGSGNWSTQFYHESLTPRVTPQPVPRRYQAPPQLAEPQDYPDGATPSFAAADDQQTKARAPKRSSSILQRFQRRRGSFRKPKKPSNPIKRSLSDRITYRHRKKWLDHEEELDPISTPSLPHPIGSLIDTRAGRLHIVDLHRPQNGCYGIYITEGETGGIFISRFANTEAEKFYCGLLLPGDEIIAINRQPIRGVSLDHVHSVLATLDSVVLTVIPIGSRPDW